MDTENEQLALVAKAIRKVKSKPAPAISAVDPIARVLVDVSLPHLDRYFDYLVPESMSASAQPGVRVRVRFAGALHDGWIVERRQSSEHVGRLERLSKVISPDPVLLPEILTLARKVADVYAGTLPDVIRAAVPARHATAEAGVGSEVPQPSVSTAPAPQQWTRYSGGQALISRLSSPGRWRAQAPGPRAVWVCAAATNPAAQIAIAAAAAASAGRGVLIVAPDARDVARLDVALTQVLGADRHEVLTADLGPAARYSAFLRIRRGHRLVALGTRAAVFAPVRDLGLIILWDDADDSLAEPHAPYWHAREVLVLRSEQSGCAMVIGSMSRSVESASLVSSGWARSVVEPRSAARTSAARVITIGADSEQARDEAAMTARLPNIAWQTVKRGLEFGPVLVQVPRRGYVPNLSCQSCRQPARCSTCQGPLGLTSGHAIATCTRCGTLAGDWTCLRCGGRRLRASSFGERRTAEELGRAFPGVHVRTSGRDNQGAGVLTSVDRSPALVVATPGAEPTADGGYAAALLLDGRVMLDRPDLRAAEQAVHRWLAAVALVRPATQGGCVVLVADPTLAPVQAVVRNDPVGFSERELHERSAAHLPPGFRVAELTGAPADLMDLVTLAALSTQAQVLGPVPVIRTRGRTVEAEVMRTLIIVPAEAGAELAVALKAATAIRSARRDGQPVNVRIDPVGLG